jgi:hypothetical protein
MHINSIKTVYWVAFGLSIITLFLNIGLGLIALGLVILPILLLHFSIGLRLTKLQNHQPAIILSALNLLTFTLLRPDGVHSLGDNGLSSLLDLVGISAGYNRDYEDYFVYSSLLLLLVQVIVDLRLRKLARR